MSKVNVAAPQAILHSVRFREELALGNLKVVKAVTPGVNDDRHREIAVSGASVFVREGAAVFEVPRSACVLRWSVAADASMLDAVAAVQGRKVAIAPDPVAEASKPGAESL